MSDPPYFSKFLKPPLLRYQRLIHWGNIISHCPVEVTTQEYVQYVCPVVTFVVMVWKICGHNIPT